jgi:hypothetical protein
LSSSGSDWAREKLDRFPAKAGIQRLGACDWTPAFAGEHIIHKPLARRLKSWKFARLANPGLDGRQNIVTTVEIYRGGCRGEGFGVDAFSF